MFVRLVTRVIVSAVVIVGVVAVTPQQALASCAELPDLETGFADADVVFIGIVTELSNNNRTATMQVEQVWKGQALPETVVVHGGPGGSDAFTSVDRAYELGTYIVFPVNSTPPFQDNACTLTQRTTTALDVINPFASEPVEQTTNENAVTTTISGVGTPEGLGSAEGPIADEPPTGESVLVSGGTDLTPLIVGSLSGAAQLEAVDLRQPSNTRLPFR